MKISKQLYNFFKAYKEWVSNGAEEGKIFERRTGLCHNLLCYHEYKGLPYSVNTELRELLENKLGDANFPFGKFSYAARKSEGTLHLCPERMSFVDKCVEAYESTGKEEKVVKSKSKSSLKIGDKVKGVKFSNADSPYIGWDHEMNYYVDDVGEVIGVDPRNDTTAVYVQFKDGNSWCYPAHLLKKEDTPKSATNNSVTPKSVWGVVDMETGNVISIEITREKARQMKARLNGDFKIAKMTFDKWVS